jgi:predicted component of type VI protein secretion system
MSRNHHQPPNEGSATLFDKTDEYRPEEVANLRAEIADLKQVIISLRAQLAEMHEYMDRWQSRADRISLTAPY